MLQELWEKGRGLFLKRFQHKEKSPAPPGGLKTHYGTKRGGVQLLANKCAFTVALFCIFFLVGLLNLCFFCFCRGSKTVIFTQRVSFSVQLMWFLLVVKDCMSFGEYIKVSLFICVCVCWLSHSPYHWRRSPPRSWTVFGAFSAPSLAPAATTTFSNWSCPMLR